MSKLLLTVPEVADVLNIGRTRVYDLMRSGELGSVKIGALRRVHVDAIEEYITSLGQAH